MLVDMCSGHEGKVDERIFFYLHFGDFAYLFKDKDLMSFANLNQLLVVPLEGPRRLTPLIFSPTSMTYPKQLQSDTWRRLKSLLA